MKEKNIERFETLLKQTGREGIEDLLGFLRKSDFYDAPASTRYHSCYEGGLLAHSLNVYDCLYEKKYQAGLWFSVLKDIPDDVIIISSLLHDICKVYFYAVDYKNQKVYRETGSKHDLKGAFDWETVPFYTVDDKMPLGHGEKSVMLLENYITLKNEERYAIRWHMGFSEPKEYWDTLAAAINKYPFVLALHEADMEATYLLEKEG